MVENNKMYSDRVAATGRKRSVKDRLGGGADSSPTYGGQSTLKRYAFL